MILLPSELIRNGVDAYLAERTTKSRIIYWIVLAAVIAAIVLLPVIHVDISVQDSGLIRPVIEKTEIKSTITEYVDSIFSKEGRKIEKGDTLLTFRSVTLDYKINYQQSRLNDLQNHINDLRYLAKDLEPPVFYSDTRRQEYTYFLKQTTEYETHVDKTTKDYERNKTLFEKKVISP